MGFGDQVRDWKQGKPKYTAYRGEAIRKTTRGSVLKGVFGVKGPQIATVGLAGGFLPRDANGTGEETSRHGCLGETSFQPFANAPPAKKTPE
jgi:hypothetical protein